MQTHVAVEQRWSRIVGHEIHFRIAESWNIRNIFYDPRSRLAIEVRKLEAMPLQAQRMAISIFVVKNKPIALSRFHLQGVGIGPRFSVDRPAISSLHQILPQLENL